MRTQWGFKTHRSRTVNTILAGNFDNPPVDVVPEPSKLEHWSKVFQTPSVEDKRSPGNHRQADWKLADPITKEHLDAVLNDSKPSSPGPDGITLSVLKGIPRSDLSTWFSIFLYTGYLPERLRGGRVTLIPKVANPTKPSQFRPITVTSIIVRTFHGIIGKRMAGLPISDQQKGFRTNLDGTAQNIWLIDKLLERARTKLKPLTLVFLDIAKAFPSVSHQSIHLAAKRSGVPGPLGDYIRLVYDTAHVTFAGSDVRCDVNSGILQGDPLSGYLFNFVMDWCFEAIDEEFGMQLDNGTRFSHTAFADDTVIASGKPIGAQVNVALVVEAFAKCGMVVNHRKCSSLEIVVDGKKKRWHQGTSPCININGEQVPSLSVAETYKYLGLRTTGTGIARADTKAELRQKLQRLSDSALRPQQRIHALRTHVIPGLNYALALGKSGKGYLKSLDKMVRQFARRWCHLHHDTPNSFIHAPAKEGGLGIPCIENNILRSRAQRYGKMEHSQDPAIKALWGELPNTYRFPKMGRIELVTNDTEKSLWTEDLGNKIDTKGLVNGLVDKRSYSWASNPELDVKGESYVRAVQVRSASLATRAKESRGGRGDGMCLTCRDRKANLGHTLQLCPRAHGLRIMRHDELVNLVAKMLRKRKWIVSDRNTIPVGNTVCKPDLIAIDRESRRIVVLDPSIVSDTREPVLQSAYNTKVDRYSIPEVRAHANTIAQEAGVENVIEQPMTFEVHGLIATWRAGWYVGSYQVLRRTLGLSGNAVQILSISILENGWKVWRAERRRTDNGRY